MFDQVELDRELFAALGRVDAEIARAGIGRLLSEMNAAPMP